MDLGPYRLVAQVGAGPDGASYRAQDDATGLEVLLRLIDGAQADHRRWSILSKRLRLAALVDHPGSVRLRSFELSARPPRVIQEWTGLATLERRIEERGRLTPEEIIGLGLRLADTLAAAHRLGLAHGRLDASQVTVGDLIESARLDFTGILSDPLNPSRRPVGESSNGRGAASAAPGPKADLHGLGRLLQSMLGDAGVGEATLGGDRQDIEPEPVAGTLAEVDGQLLSVVGDLLREDPDERPSAREVAARLERLVVVSAIVDRSAPGTMPTFVEGLAGGQKPASSFAGVAIPERLGRFRILEKLGQGGMGAVYRARDSADDSIVAVKILRSELASRPEALRRFQKEARLLAEVHSPHVTNLIEVNEDDGLHFLVMELVEGENLGQWLTRFGRLGENLASSIVADTARGLAAAHEQGIIHRDVKPENILLIDRRPAMVAEETDGTFELPSLEDAPPTVKLSDFGLARHIVEHESLQVTRAFAVLGTPAYMSPEQAGGAATDPRSDVYSLGATLYHMLAGRPPFEGQDLLELIARHRDEAPAPLRSLNPGVSDGLAALVEKALAKAPDGRHADATALLEDLDRLRRGEPSRIELHPKLPTTDPARAVGFDFQWDLEASPRQLWPLVGNTERLNRAIGLPPASFHFESGTDGGRRRMAEARVGGRPARWEEHPFEWIEPRRFGVLRTFEHGPLRWFVSQVELLAKPGGGTTLVHRIRLEPAQAWLRPILRLQMNGSGKRALEAVYRRIDESAVGRLTASGGHDPFEGPPKFTPTQRRHLDEALDRLVTRGVDPAVVQSIGNYLADAPDPEVARIRPIALARRLRLDADEVLRACLLGAREGLLTLLWDLLCPVCRIPSEVQQTLRNLKDHGRCDACNLDYDLDFAGSVELIFRLHPEIRPVELATYCVGGPSHSPHVIAQVRVAPAERFEMPLSLIEGAYQISGPQLPASRPFRVEPGAGGGRWEVDLGHSAPLGASKALGTGTQLIELVNPTSHELLVRVERTAPRADAVTAARAASLALFRELFPDQVLAPDRLVGITNLTLLVTDLPGAEALYQERGDAAAFGPIHAHLVEVDGHVRRHRGAVVKTIGEGLLAAFHEPEAAVAAALDALAGPGVALDETILRPRAAVHRGPAMVTTLNDHLDYFGSTVNVVTRLPALVAPGELALTSSVATDERAAAVLAAVCPAIEIIQTNIPGLTDAFVHRVAVPPG